MSFNPELVQELSERARPHYIDTLPYHNWEHARDVMTVAVDIARRSPVSEVSNRGQLLQIAAAWHDADYHVEDPTDHRTKEERSADLVRLHLTQLTASARSDIASAIIDTTVSKTHKDSLLSEALHAADIGYFFATQRHFYRRLSLMRDEWGSPDWQTTAARTIAFGEQLTEEMHDSLPRLLTPSDAESWLSQLSLNLDDLAKRAETDNFPK